MTEFYSFEFTNPMQGYFAYNSNDYYYNNYNNYAFTYYPYNYYPQPFNCEYAYYNNNNTNNFAYNYPGENYYFNDTCCSECSLTNQDLEITKPVLKKIIIKDPVTLKEISIQDIKIKITETRKRRLTNGQINAEEMVLVRKQKKTKIIDPRLYKIKQIGLYTKTPMGLMGNYKA